MGTTTYLRRVPYFYKKVWKANGLKDIIKQGLELTIHPQKWYHVFTWILILGVIMLWLVIATVINPFSCWLVAIRKPSHLEEMGMWMDGYRGKRRKKVDDDDDVPF